MAPRGVDVDVGAGEDAVEDAGAGVVEDEALHGDEAVGEVAGAVAGAVEDVVADEAAVKIFILHGAVLRNQGSPLGQLQHEDNGSSVRTGQLNYILFSYIYIECCR